MREVLTRRAWLLLAAGAAVPVAAVVALRILDLLVTPEVMWFSAAVAVSGALAVVLFALRWADRRADRRAVALSRRVSELEDGLTSLASTVGNRLDVLTGGVSAVSKGLEGLSRSSAADYRQLEAYVDLRGLIRPRAPMPPLRGWAASPDVLRFLMEIMLRLRPKLIVECGSGSSSIWLGYLAEQNAPAKVICLEHDERYAEVTADLIRAHGLGGVVEVRSAPLSDWKCGLQSYSWYDVGALKDLSGIGLLFVDGPPAATGPDARYPAIPLLLPRCSDDAVIVLDDSEREEESTISDRWLAEFPEISRSVQRFEKGAHVFTRRTS